MNKNLKGKKMISKVKKLKYFLKQKRIQKHFKKYMDFKNQEILLKRIMLKNELFHKKGFH